MASSMFIRALARGLVWERRFHAGLQRAQMFRDGVLLEGLTATEREAFGGFLYDVSSANRGEGLFDWEQLWFERDLPSARSAVHSTARSTVRPRVLAGGVGAGREVLALRERGFEVVAFEPSADLATVCEERTGQPIFRASYRNLVDAASPSSSDAPFAREINAKPFDAILLGWGSLSHILDDTEARALLQACDRLCPAGPILTSFLLDFSRGGAGVRTFERGRGLGRTIANLRGASTSPHELAADAPPSSVSLDPHVGFLRFWSEEFLASALPSREMELTVTPYPHATFRAGLNRS